jgi:hypothetical protein
MKFENVQTYNFEHALRGMRNPKNSWHLSDSSYGMCRWDCLTEIAKPVFEQYDYEEEYEYFTDNGLIRTDDEVVEYAYIGPKDMKLAQNLIKAGPEHRKFLRQIFVTVDITAPLYFYKEFDTYKVSTVANSTSTMHKLTSKPISADCFELGDVHPSLDLDNGTIGEIAEGFIERLEEIRQKYLAFKDTNPNLAKLYWKELVRWLPESWLQTRTVTMNYETLRSMYHQRKEHKLVEWRIDFVNFIKTLPYANEFILFEN